MHRRLSSPRPPSDSGYHTYAEMIAFIDGLVADHPAIASKFSYGTSYEGRQLVGVKISDNVGTDEAEPEVLFTAHQHAREHLTVEMALYIMDLLTDGYGADSRITSLVNSREIWIMPGFYPPDEQIGPQTTRNREAVLRFLAYDIDGGVTSIQSPPIALPAGGTTTLSFSWHLAHGSNASGADYFRVRVVGNSTATVFQQAGAASDRDGAWSVATADLSPFAGQTVRILIDAADAAGASLVEAAVDDVRITRQS